MKLLATLNLSSDFIAVGLSTIIISSCSMLLYSDFTQRVDIAGAKEIGSITYKKRIAQRKYSNQVIWEDVEKNVTVYNNDSIRTADMSEAVVHLKDGTDIQLANNSMILLTMAKDSININFDHGTVFAKRGEIKGTEVKAVNIVSKGTTVSIEKSDVKLSKEKGEKELDLTVSKGSAKLTTGDVEKTIDKDMRAVIKSGEKEATIYKLNLKLISPPPNKFFISSGKAAPINFSWLSDKNVKGVTFEISSSSGFGRSIINRAATGNGTSASLQGGSYYWRIRAKNQSTGKAEFSETRRVIVVSDNPIRLIAPSNGRSFSYTTKMPIIHFTWAKNNLATGYILEIAADRGFSRIIRTINTPLTGVSLDSLKEGTHYWRIRTNVGFIQESYSSKSSVYNFKITKKKTLEPPVLIAPINNSTITKYMVGNHGVLFSWRADQQINKYRLTIAKDKSFTAIISNRIINGNFATLKNELSAGKYFWRVSSIGGEITVSSPPRIFNIISTEKLSLIAPAHKTIVELKETETFSAMSFSWKKSNIKGRYQLEVSNNKNFIPLYTKRITSTNSFYINRLKPGRYYWHVRLLDNRNNEIILSPTFSFDINKKIKIIPVPVDVAKVKTSGPITPDANKEIKPEIKPKKETILIVRSPIKGSSIYINGKFKGYNQTSFVTEPGKRVFLTISAKGFNSFSTMAILKEGEKRVLRAKLFRKKEEKAVTWIENLKAPVSSKPIHHKGTTILTSSDGKIIGLKKDGKRIFTKKLSKHSEGTPVISKSTLYTVDIDGYLHSINITNGKTNWKRKARGPLLFGSKPLVVNDVIFVASSMGIVQAFSNTGKELWSATLDGGIFNSIEYHKGVLYIGTNSRKIYALDSNDGDEKWTFEVDSRMVSSSPKIYRDSLFIGCYSGTFYSIEIDDGDLKWSFKAKDSIFSTPAFSDDLVYFGSIDGKLHALKVKDGKEEWSYDTRERIFSEPLIAHGLIYVPSGKILYALNLTTGKLRWKKGFTNRIKTGVSSSGKDLYVGLDNGRVVSLRSDLQILSR